MPHENTAKELVEDEVAMLCLDEFLTELPSEPGAASAAPERPPPSTSVRALRPAPPSQRQPVTASRSVPVTVSRSVPLAVSRPSASKSVVPRRGPSLAEVLRVRESLPLNEAVDWISSLCEAVHETHEAGLVYGNLATEVLFLDRSVDQPPRLCFVDLGSSSLACRAPEQVRTPSNVDHRADVWALGALLYEMVAGRPAFVADDDVELRAKIASADVADLSTVRRELPLGFVATVHACLQVEPWLRLQSASDLRLMLVPFSSRRSARIASVVPCVGTQSNAEPHSAPITLVGHPTPITLASERAAVVTTSAVVSTRAVAVSTRAAVTSRAPTFYSLLAPYSEPSERDFEGDFERDVERDQIVSMQRSRRLAPASVYSRPLVPKAPLSGGGRTGAGLRHVLTGGTLAAATVFTAVVATVVTSRWLERSTPRPRTEHSARVSSTAEDVGVAVPSSVSFGGID
jgi:hypothetical protein